VRPAAGGTRLLQPRAAGCTFSRMSDRTLPHNLEAEKCVLGAILINNHAFNQAAEVIDAGDFFRDAHRRIFEKMVALTDQNEPVDLVTLKDELTRSDELDEVGGPAYISALTDGVPRSANVEYYARIVKEKSTLRRLIQSATEVLSRAYDAEEDADDLLDEAERSIFQIAEHRLRSGFVPVSQLVDSGYQLIEQLQEHRGLVTGAPSGFVDLDEMTSGFQKSDLVIVAARPSMGKTSFVLNIALHCGIEAGKTVGMFSLEMSKEQLFMRMLTSEARVDAHRFRGGFLGEQDYARLVEAFARLHDAKVFIDDTPSVGILEMRAKSRRLKLEHGLDLLIIDYLQLMQGRGRFENRQQELASISRALKILAKELNVPILALSQLSRAPEARGDHRPQLSDLRESGALEQDADVVLFIFREEMYAQEGERSPDAEGTAEVIIGKQRNGPTGTVRLAFLKQYTRFENLAAGVRSDREDTGL
jgi:replicative DNA helicase